MQFLFIFITIVAGTTNALQSGSNQALQKSLAAQLWTIVAVAGVTFAAALGVALASGTKLPTGLAIAAAPWWGWIGGLFGLGFVLGTVFSSARLGAGAFIAILVTAELITSVTLDHFGLMGFEPRRAGLWRLLGAGLMIAGVTLVAAS